MAVKTGDTVKVHYTGTLTDGTTFDSSHERNQPLEFAAGTGQMIKGFDDAILGMTEGETKTFTVSSSEAYGERNDDATASIASADLPDDFDYNEGDRVVTQTQDGQQLQATIASINDDGVVLDFNHPLSGHDLTFDIELLEIATS